MSNNYENLIRNKAHQLWLKYDKPVNKDLDIWLESEKIIYNDYYLGDMEHKGLGAVFKTKEIRGILTVELSKNKPTENYRIDDILMMRSNYNRFYNYLFIRVTGVNKKGKILNFIWTYGNRNCNKTVECHKKFGDVTRKALYIGRCKNKKIIRYEKLKDINEKNIIQEWSQKCN